MTDEFKEDKKIRKNKRLAYSGQRPAGMEEGCTGSQGPQSIVEIEKEDEEEQEEEKREK